MTLIWYKRQLYILCGMLMVKRVSELFLSYRAQITNYCIIAYYFMTRM